ncbi:MAG: hypothetical protein RL172_3176 [Bacteroidota bacterium]|jgi:hypothetical protein
MLQLKRINGAGFIKQLYWLSIFLVLSANVWGQGDGPRTCLVSPKGIWGVTTKWLNMQQNFLPSGTIFVPDASIKVNAFPLVMFYNFSIGKQFAQVIGVAAVGKTSGTIKPANPNVPDIGFTASGFSDGLVGIKIGIIGAPALNLAEFAAKKPAFSMMGFFRYWYSGTYNSTKAVSMGTNRSTLQFSLPMSMPLGKNVSAPWWLEVHPSIEFYTANNQPPTITGGKKITQHPIFALETHVTKNISPKVWVGTGLRYYYGGLTFLDGQSQQNLMNVLATGAIVGYQPIKAMGFNLSYGTVLSGYNNASVKMFRLAATYTHFKASKKSE